MKIGKLTIADLETLVLKNIHTNNEEIISMGEIGRDCAAIGVGDKVVYLSTDPITGASAGLGKLAININCNDIATEGVQPLGIMLTILAPPETTKDEIQNVVKEAQKEAEKIGVTIIGGHTEITNAVNKMVISATALGIGEREERNNFVNSGDRIVITKGCGIEGTGIIAFEKELELEKALGKEIVEKGKSLLDLTSVVKDGLVAKKFSKGMHDVTEGGLLGAIWETCSLYKLGVEIDFEKIKIDKSTEEICKYYNINPLKLISSGTMLIVVSKEDVKDLCTELSKNGIESFDIGEFTESLDKILKKDEKEIEIEAPESDELYKIV